ncbi:MAG: hypothetical protein JWM41_2970 [Gemmatimonadetes bacterium]|nr:hypothetical protein [Gemmatimonadota bacterium]
MHAPARNGVAEIAFTPPIDSDREAARRAVRLAAVCVLGVVAAGLIAIPRISMRDYIGFSLFFEQFVRIEPAPLCLVAGFAVVVLLCTRQLGSVDVELSQPRYRPWVIALGSLLVAAVVWGGITLVFHRFLLADDEYSAWFQAVIYSRGHASAVVAPEWCRWIAALTPTSISATPGCTWRLSYLPIHSLYNAGFIALGLDRLGGPVAAGLSVWLVASIARKVWPSRPLRAYLAALFTATSTQVLFMSMTMFSMSTHLLFSLAWLWLYVDERKWSNALLPWVGVAALGVHSPFPHALLIPPFLLRYLRNRRYAFLGYVAAVYAGGLSYWYGYLARVSNESAPAFASPGATAAVAKGLFHLPTAVQSLTTGLHLALVPSWNAPLVILLMIVAMLSWDRLDTFSRDASLSVVLIIVARMLMPTPQGEGWGYRFIYDALGIIALLAAVGVERLATATGARTATRLIVASLAISLFVQLPLRARNVAQVISPYRNGLEWMSTLPYDVVIYPADLVNWGRQLVRNDPFLRNTPKIMSRRELTPENQAALAATATLRQTTISRADLIAHGLPLAPFSMGAFQIAP